MLKLFEFRNECPAFDGEFKIVDTDAENKLSLIWQNGDCTAKLRN